MTEELIWKTFKTGLPKCSWIWASDYQDVWLCSTDEYWINKNQDYIWAEAKIEHPPVPQRKAHECTDNGAGTYCKEHRPGRLTFRINEEWSEVNFCPICGKKAGD